ncbi:MAG: tRNA (adenosine(37)-N6)-dimethylallyltransferase MiaA [Epulopiscium sp.]|mgnify:CR=1 FL=1|nr:tRNA (adenosine(37)-N6)-dimethylallyltransferase MiaA [Candidatus Epulonipiscium sp.]
MNKPLVVIGGPTASGKTKVGIELAQLINGEIISADSMQVYRYMDIGTAKPTLKEMNGIPHHLIDEIDPDEEWNVTLFQKKAKQHIEQIYHKNKIPILLGGTGFYIQSVIYDIDFTEMEVDFEYRNQLQHLQNQYGNDYLHKKLEKVDPISAQKIHPNNIKRIIRALEYYTQTGIPISQHNEQQRQKNTPYQLSFFALTMDRHRLYQRINQRVEKMINDGLIEEVQNLLTSGYSPELVSMQGLGYKELIPYINGQQTLEEAIYTLKRDTRHFAKRQLTWFRREKNLQWIYMDNPLLNFEEIILKIKNCIEENVIII